MGLWRVLGLCFAIISRLKRLERCCNCCNSENGTGFSSFHIHVTACHSPVWRMDFFKDPHRFSGESIGLLLISEHLRLQFSTASQCLLSILSRMAENGSDKYRVFSPKPRTLVTALNRLHTSRMALRWHLGRCLRSGSFLLKCDALHECLNR